MRDKVDRCRIDSVERVASIRGDERRSDVESAREHSTWRRASYEHSQHRLENRGPRRTLDQRVFITDVAGVVDKETIRIVKQEEARSVR